MLKMNNKGFALVETLVAAVFIMAIFSIIYTNYYPIIGEYERRQLYDSIDDKYAAYWLKKIIQDNTVSFTATNNGSKSINASLTDYKYYEFKCNVDIKAGESGRRATNLRICEELFSALEVEHVYITAYKLDDRDDESATYFKDVVARAADNDPNKFSSGLVDYVAFLPTYYRVSSPNGANHRIIVEFHHTKNDNDLWTYSNIEVLKR